MLEEKERKETKAQRVERIKKQKDGLDVIEDIKYYATNNLPVDNETIDRLKWYGMYLQRNHNEEDTKQFFMLRVKLLNGEVSKQQLKVLHFISKNYGQNTANFTVRQDIQFYFLQIVDIPHIFDLLHSVGLNSIMASGDVPRNTVSCPVCDRNTTSIINTKPIVHKINAMYESNKEFSNLPRKFKIGINGCTKHCIYHEIQDLGFTGLIYNNSIVFDISVGGGLSGGKQIAKRLGIACTQEDIIPISRAVALIFRDHGNRENRAKARMRHLIDNWGIEKFKEELFKYVKNTFIEIDEPMITTKHQRNHIGEELQTNGLYTLGCATVSGRVLERGLNKIVEIVEKYNIENLALTTTQDFIFFNVSPSDIENIKKDLYPEFNASPKSLQAKTLACTGMEFCKFALTETKLFSKNLMDEINNAIPNLPVEFNLHISGCNNSCSQPQVADIGLIACMTKNKEGKRAQGFEVFVGGYLKGAESVFNQSTGVKLALEDVSEYIINIIQKYIDHYLDKEDFHTYLKRLLKK